MNKRLIVLAAGHVLAIALGISFATIWHRGEVKPKAGDSISSKTAETTSKSGPSITRVSRRAKLVEVKMDAATLKGAWQEMQRQSPADRERLRPQLLAKWAEVDLAGALEAALLEPDSTELLSVFNDFFEKNPEAFQPLLAGEKFGLKSAEFRGWWIDHMAYSDSESLLTSIGDFNEIDQQKIVTACAENMEGDHDRIWGMVDNFAKLPDTPENRKLWAMAARAAASRATAETVIEKFPRSAAPPAMQ